MTFTTLITPSSGEMSFGGNIFQKKAGSGNNRLELMCNGKRKHVLERLTIRFTKNSRDSMILQNSTVDKETLPTREHLESANPKHTVGFKTV